MRHQSEDAHPDISYRSILAILSGTKSWTSHKFTRHNRMVDNHIRSKYREASERLAQLQKESISHTYNPLSGLRRREDRGAVRESTLTRGTVEN